jgi:hypothetical protein
VAGCCKHGNLLVGSVRCGEFLDCVPKRDSSSWSEEVGWSVSQLTAEFRLRSKEPKKTS